jgi:uncharacterized membrane protein YgcG
MKISRYAIIGIVLQLIIFKISLAQTTQTLQPPPLNILVDGNIKEWGDSLRYYNKEKKINFAIANTKDTLYMAIRVNDRSEQTRILRAGITFSIDPKGKKKETFSLTFPLNVGGTAPKLDLHKEDNGEITPQEREELQKERLTTLRGIRCVGFKDIEDEMITTSNTYGIKAAVNYDDNEYLVCEAAIPLSFFHVEDISKNEWAFNFKINGITRPEPTHNGEEDAQSSGGGRGGRGGGMGGEGMGGGGRGGHGGGHKGGGQNADSGQGSGVLFKSEDFWEKYYLAK